MLELVNIIRNSLQKCGQELIIFLHLIYGRSNVIFGSHFQQNVWSIELLASYFFSLALNF